MDPEVRAWRVATTLFVLSGLVVFALGAVWWGTGTGEGGALRQGAGFALALLAFFVAHEAGHMVAARRHRIAVGPPMFLPIGVVMHLREPPATRSGLLALGAAGPLAGVAALATLLALRLLLGGPVAAPDPRVELAAPLLWWIVALPLGGGAPSAADPVAVAFCLGSLVTTLNLLPFGQLDGGHVVAALWPRRAAWAAWGITALLLAAGTLWFGWAVWAALIHLAGSRHPMQVRHDREPPDRVSRRLAVAAAIALILCATPVPVR